jgi:hypothetical protein
MLTLSQTRRSRWYATCLQLLRRDRRLAEPPSGVWYGSVVVPVRCPVAPLLQKRGYFSKAFSTWGLNLTNGPYSTTYRPMDLVEIKKKHQDEMDARGVTVGKGRGRCLLCPQRRCTLACTALRWCRSLALCLALAVSHGTSRASQLCSP